MQYFRKHLALIFSLSFFLFSFLTLLPTPSHAEIDAASIATWMTNFPKDNPWALAKEFCDKRNGDLMNLETWYSGKCGKDINSKSGEGVGFVDIVILQGYEWLFRPQTKSLPEQMIDNLKDLETIREKITYQNYKEKLAELALKQSKNKDIISSLEQATKNVITTQPVSSVDYLAYVGNNLKKNHVVDSAYAATPGYGFGGLAPILPIWKAFRNIAYMLFAIAFVMYGVMIMFRIRVDGKTAATITLAIPKLITTLLLITFSYAIVGLLVDLSTVASALLIDVLRVGKIIKDPIEGVVRGSSGLGSWGMIGSFLINTLSSIIISPFIVFNLLLGGFFSATWAWVGIVLSLATGIGEAIAIILVIAVIWSYIKLILKLFQSYLSIIVSLVFSPIILLGNVMPGSKAFSGWIMGILGNLSTFPAAAFLLTLSYALMMQPVVNAFPNANLGVVSLAPSGGNGWTTAAGTGTNMWAPQIVVPQGGGLGDLMLATIGIGLLLMSSKYVDMVLKAFNTPPFPYGAAIGDALKYGYSQASDPNSSYRTSKFGNRANAVTEGLYNIGPKRLTGNTIWQDTKGMF